MSKSDQFGNVGELGRATENGRQGTAICSCRGGSDVIKRESSDREQKMKSRRRSLRPGIALLNLISENSSLLMDHAVIENSSTERNLIPTRFFI